MSLFKVTTLLITTCLFTAVAEAAKRASPSLKGDSSMSFQVGSINSTQGDINSNITAVNTTGGGVSTGSMTTAWEYSFSYNFRFSGTMFSLVFKPSYFSAKAAGSGSSVGELDYVLNGYTFFPLLRITPLENDFISFYMQGGVGYGSVNGSITQGSSNMNFTGANYGGQVGIGAEFCFSSSSCVSVEGTARYLPIAQIYPQSGFGQSFTGISRNNAGAEINHDGHDMSVSMSGILGALGYTYYF